MTRENEGAGYSQPVDPTKAPLPRLFSDTERALQGGTGGGDEGVGEADDRVTAAGPSLEGESAADAGADCPLSQQDLDAAVTFSGALPGVDPEARARFRAALDAHRRTCVELAGLADPARLGHHQRARLERVAIQRALQECHILTIEGRDYRR